MKFFLGQLRGMTTFLLGENSPIPFIRRYVAKSYVASGYLEEKES